MASTIPDTALSGAFCKNKNTAIGSLGRVGDQIMRTTNQTLRPRPRPFGLLDTLSAHVPVRAIWTNWRRRRKVMVLRSMDDRMLNDIGLSRSDVDGAFATPWYVDPSPDLNLRRVRNRNKR